MVPKRRSYPFADAKAVLPRVQAVTPSTERMSSSDNASAAARAAASGTSSLGYSEPMYSTSAMERYVLSQLSVTALQYSSTLSDRIIMTVRNMIKSENSAVRPRSRRTDRIPLRINILYHPDQKDYPAKHTIIPSRGQLPRHRAAENKKLLRFPGAVFVWINQSTV